MDNDTTTPRTDAESEGNYFSDSPRVNALIVELRKPSDGDRMDMISLARQLERELNESETERKELWSRFDKQMEAEQKLEKAEAEAARLKQLIRDAVPYLNHDEKTCDPLNIRCVCFLDEILKRIEEEFK
jgi:hypothetical protein